MMTSTPGVAARYTILALVIAAASWGLLAHRSDQPFIFGYSLFYLGCLLFCVVTLVFTIFLFRRFKSSAWYAIAAIVLPVSAIAVSVEIFAQVYAFRNPSYEVYYVQPDRLTGWRLVPNLHFIWAGPQWAAFEFSVPIVINSAGFRDLERTVEKPPDVARVALLGDSLVEALQVAFEKTAGHVLERTLNSTEAQDAVRHQKYEVLNFGVSAYGLGQYLLTWKRYARAYHPEYVFAYVARFHMVRTVSKGGMLTQGLKDLWVRPTFRLQSNELVLEPAGEFEEFVATQQKLIQNDLGGQRMRKKRLGLFLRIVLDEVNDLGTSVQNGLAGGRDPTPGFSDEILAVNARILEELGTSVNAAGGRLIVVDAVQYHGGSVELSGTLRALCADRGFGYVNVSDDLMRKHTEGISTTRAYDGHFNEVGNEVFAAAMHQWMRSSQNVHE